MNDNDADLIRIQANTILILAIKNIDECFGDGYAKTHPRLLSTLVKVMSANRYKTSK